jgi:hypothetical protein
LPKCAPQACAACRSIARMPQNPWPHDEAIGSSYPRKRRQRRREDLKEHPGEEEEKQHMLPRYASRPFSIACLILLPESLPLCRVSRRRALQAQPSRRDQR